MLDVFSLIEERGGNPEAIRESQRRRHANVDIVDEIIREWNECKEGERCRCRRLIRTDGLGSPIRSHHEGPGRKRYSEGDWNEEEGAHMLGTLAAAN